MLEQTSSKKTKLSPTSFVDERQVALHIPTEEESIILQKVLQRYNLMRSNRVSVDRHWQTSQLQYEAAYYPYKDGRSRSNVPLEWALTELFVAQALNVKSVPKFLAQGDTDVSKEEVIKRVWEYDRIRYRRDESIYKAEYDCALHGTAMYFNGFESKSRVITDPEVINGEIVGVRKLMERDKIILDTLDIRDVFLDERVGEIDLMNDQVYLQYITPDELEEYKFDKNFKNLDAVDTMAKVDQAFWTKEERMKNNGSLVELMHYWNKQADKYIVLANRTQVVKDTFIPYAHKELPITPRPLALNRHSMYGRGFGEACLNFKSQINDLQEMIMDGIKRSNNSIFAIGSGLTFDGNSFGFNNTLVNFQGKLDDSNFRELRGQAPNQAIFNYTDNILKQIAMYIGIDISQITGGDTATAFQAAIKTETELKRVNVWLNNRDMSLSRVYQKHLQNIQQYFPVKTAKGLLEIDDKGQAKKGKEKYPTIMLDGEKYTDNEFIQFDGKYPFEVKPEYIRGEIDVLVSTNFNAPTLRQLRRENLKDFVGTVANYTTLIQNSPDISEIIKPKDFINQLAEDYDVDVNSIGGMPQSRQKEKEELMERVRQMMGVPPSPGAMPQPGGSPAGMPPVWDTQAPAGPAWAAPTPGAAPMGPTAGAGERQMVGGISVPNIPTIQNLNPAQKSMI